MPGPVPSRSNRSGNGGRSGIMSSREPKISSEGSEIWLGFDGAGCDGRLGVKFLGSGWIWVRSKLGLGLGSLRAIFFGGWICFCGGLFGLPASGAGLFGLPASGAGLLL